MNIFDAVKERHTIRNYDGRAIEGENLKRLEELISEVNLEGGLHFQLVNGQENALDAFTIRYGKWTNVTNYIALIGKESDDLEERCGYYGEKIVLWAQMAGLKTGWVETGYDVKPETLEIADDERLVLSICIGYSEQMGNSHRVKAIEELSTVTGEAPDWFNRGMEYAVLAPTAGNQQLFNIAWDGNALSISTKPGFLEKVDLGIIKYHFELGSGIDHSKWN